MLYIFVKFNILDVFFGTGAPPRFVSATLEAGCLLADAWARSAPIKIGNLGFMRTKSDPILDDGLINFENCNSDLDMAEGVTISSYMDLRNP